MSDERRKQFRCATPWGLDQPVAAELAGSHSATAVASKSPQAADYRTAWPSRNPWPLTTLQQRRVPYGFSMTTGSANALHSLPSPWMRPATGIGLPIPRQARDCIPQGIGESSRLALERNIQPTVLQRRGHWRAHNNSQLGPWSILCHPQASATQSASVW